MKLAVLNMAWMVNSIVLQEIVMNKVINIYYKNEIQILIRDFSVDIKISIFMSKFKGGILK